MRVKMNLENIKDFARNGSLFCKHCKINVAWLDGWMGWWEDFIYYYKSDTISRFLGFFLSLF